MSPLAKLDDTTTMKKVATADDDGIIDTVVIGAGWAGLSAARHLHSHGVSSLVVLEGRAVLGGRCRTGIANDGVTPVELGAQWIHGVNKTNPVYQAALAAGVSMARSSLDCQVIYRDGSDGGPTTQVSEERSDFFYDYLMQGKGGFWAYQKRRQDNDDHDVSVHQCAQDFLNKINATDEQREWFWYLLDSSIGQEYGASLEDLSMYWWDSDTDMRGGDAYVTQDIHGGYFQILQHFAKPIADSIQYNAKVSSIDYSRDHCEIRYTINGIQKQVTCRHVIVTVPLGVLKAQVIDFTPALPDQKQRAIQKVGMGVLNKCILLWDDKDAHCLPWPADKEWIERIVTGQDPDKPQGLWTEFVNAQASNGRPALIGFTAGRVARDLSKHSDAEIQTSVMTALRAMFTGHDIPNPKQVLITRWDQDEFAFGSYSFNQIGARHNDRQKIADPIDRKVYFAGEHCHLQYFGTTHGAYMTGADAAKQLLEDAGKVITGNVRVKKTGGARVFFQRLFA